MRIKLSDYAKQEGLTYRTALRYYHNGLIKGIQLPTGTILVEMDSPLVPVEEHPRVAALYSRVSSSHNKSNLDAQQARLEAYAASRGYTIGPNVKEIGSGLNDQRPKLLQLFKDDWDVLIIEHKDRLTRFGYAYLEAYTHSLGRSIEIINVSEDKEDLMEDFVSLLTSFTARIYGRRGTRRATIEILEGLKNG